MAYLEKINSIKNRLGGMYLYLKDHPERLTDSRTRERIEKLALDFNEMVDDLLYPDNQKTSKPENKEVTPEQVAAIFDGEVVP